MRLTFDHKKIEKKWRKKWFDNGTYTPDVKKSKNTFYNLWMFPYPSAEGLHAGHAFASTGSDVYGRFMRMNKKDVFQPIGYDSFGIHSENFALSIKEHPETMIERTTKYYEKQLKNLGHGYDWTRTVTTSKVDYYRWTQWLFLDMFKAGLAYRKEAEVNWCPSCKTVLADEQVLPAGPPAGRKVGRAFKASASDVVTR
ncbi:class I tRNA ligase family protein [Patescibacteria group bacterium]|nr:class I tRNA ligase family protein [Patescibacteria group bacterium]